MHREIECCAGPYRRDSAGASAPLLSVGKPEVIDQACQRSAVGHLVENALFARREAREGLAPVVRIYEGCARALLGEVEGANVLKLHRYSGKVTYLVCPGLDREPDPALELRIKVTLPALAIDGFDYRGREERPRLGGDARLLGRAGT